MSSAAYRPTPSPETKLEPVDYLGDVFSSVNELVLNGEPVPGAELRFLVVADGGADYRSASAAIAPLSTGPFAIGDPRSAGSIDRGV